MHVAPEKYLLIDRLSILVYSLQYSYISYRFRHVLEDYKEFQLL